MGDTGNIFQTTPKGILPVHNVAAYSNKVYEACGRILAMGIIHGSKSPMCFTPEAAHFIVHGTPLECPESDRIDGIPDMIHQDKIKQVSISVYLECIL